MAEPFGSRPHPLGRPDSIRPFPPFSGSSGLSLLKPQEINNKTVKVTTFLQDVDVSGFNFEVDKGIADKLRVGQKIELMIKLIIRVTPDSAQNRP